MISIVGVRIYSIWDIVGMALDYLIKEASLPIMFQILPETHKLIQILKPEVVTRIPLLLISLGYLLM